MNGLDKAAMDSAFDATGLPRADAPGVMHLAFREIFDKGATAALAYERKRVREEITVIADWLCGEAEKQEWSHRRQTYLENAAKLREIIEEGEG